MAYQRTASSSTFQPQQMAQPPIETLLFNDIIEEKSAQLRDIMDQFLQVHSFSKFESEFNLFIRRIKHIAKDGQRNGTNLTRHTMQMPSDNGARLSSKPTEDGGSQVNNTGEPANAFKRPSVAEYKPKTTLTRNSQSNNILNKTMKFCDTIIEESSMNDTAQEDTQQPEFLPPTEVDQPPKPNPVSSQNDNASPTTFNNGNDDDTMEFDSELVESVQIPNSSDNTSESELSADQSNGSVRSLEKSKVKYLTNWSVNTKQIKSNKGNSKSVITLTGTLLAGDQTTELKKVHKAGILVVRKTKQIVKTDNGLYHLIGPIAEGSPANLFRACVETNGIPKIWRNILINLSTEVEVNLNESMTRKGTIYNKEKKSGHNSSGQKANFGRDLINDKDFRQQLTELSTSRTIKPFTVCHTPTQLLKHKFHRKYVKACLIIGSQGKTDEKMDE
ncbi:uncharacterized protein LOC100569334 [Acyrthosiphon pisum]|uniref:Uncharacterized protein n=1 Tax=Acyrthosiphon pisum TaxID=7029 RepID=A0A8R2ACE9_ACYPI|nr:uncharacterized protein LOC100569334 [Acyrthosiphon pisum]|eukprot:XP_003245548.1 PREDICTED: uncharacterized protein LOC100569334 [Acyrthosiphon pisum]